MESSKTFILDGPKRNLHLEVYSYVLRQKLGQDAIMGRQEGKKTKNQENNKFYEQFKPMFILLILFGRLSFRKNKDRFEWKYVSWLMLYCVLNYSLQTYLAMLVFLKRLNALRDSKRNYDELIFSIHVMAYLQIHYHLPFTYWAQGPKIPEYLNLWKTFQNLKTRPNALFLQHWRRLWVSLSSLCSCLGSHLAAIVISIVFTFSLTFLLGLYNALSHIISLNVSWKTLGYFLASLLSLLIIYAFIDAGQKGSSEVTSQVLKEVLSAKISSNSQDIRFEVNFLIEAIRNDPPQIDLGGFVIMNRHLFIGFVSNTLTYLIVILQFKFN